MEDRTVRSPGVRRVASVGSALIVGAIAAWASYTHMRDLALAHGQPEGLANWWPLSVDGMMVAATIGLGDGRPDRRSAWLAFWVGVIVSVTANILAADANVVARAISAWPALAFLLSIEVITRAGRAVPTVVPVPTPIGMPPVVPTEPAAELAEPAPAVVPRATGNPAKVAHWHAKHPDATHADLAKRAGVSVRTVARYRPVNGREPELAGQR
jgi:hypothetical protein